MSPFALTPELFTKVREKACEVVSKFPQDPVAESVDFKDAKLALANAQRDIVALLKLQELPVAWLNTYFQFKPEGTHLEKKDYSVDGHFFSPGADGSVASGCEAFYAATADDAAEKSLTYHLNTSAEEEVCCFPEFPDKLKEFYTEPFAAALKYGRLYHYQHPQWRLRRASKNRFRAGVYLATEAPLADSGSVLLQPLLETFLVQIAEAYESIFLEFLYREIRKAKMQAEQSREALARSKGQIELLRPQVVEIVERLHNLDRPVEDLAKVLLPRHANVLRAFRRLGDCFEEGRLLSERYKIRSMHDPDSVDVDGTIRFLNFSMLRFLDFERETSILDRVPHATLVANLLNKEEGEARPPNDELAAALRRALGSLCTAIPVKQLPVNHGNFRSVFERLKAASYTPWKSMTAPQCGLGLLRAFFAIDEETTVASSVTETTSSEVDVTLPSDVEFFLSASEWFLIDESRNLDGLSLSIEERGASRSLELKRQTFRPRNRKIDDASEILKRLNEIPSIKEYAEVRPGNSTWAFSALLGSGLKTLERDSTAGSVCFLREVDEESGAGGAENRPYYRVREVALAGADTVDRSLSLPCLNSREGEA